MKQETTFKDFMENFYKKPFNQIPKKELNEHYKELFGMGLSKADEKHVDDLSDDGSDLDELNEIMEGGK